jgi:hypothetical protein
MGRVGAAAAPERSLSVSDLPVLELPSIPGKIRRTCARAVSVHWQTVVFCSKGVWVGAVQCPLHSHSRLRISALRVRDQ